MKLSTGSRNYQSSENGGQTSEIQSGNVVGLQKQNRNCGIHGVKIRGLQP